MPQPQFFNPAEFDVNNFDLEFIEQLGINNFAQCQSQGQQFSDNETAEEIAAAKAEIASWDGSWDE